MKTLDQTKAEREAAIADAVVQLKDQSPTWDGAGTGLLVRQVLYALDRKGWIVSKTVN